MKYGLIGEKLGHSFSKPIHESLCDYEYDLHPVAKEEFDDFMKKKDFLGINVTIPYKQSVIPYCDEFSDAAKSIGCVNTIVKRFDGSLFGHNTDYNGFLYLVKKTGIDFNNKNVIILGKGATSLTVKAVSKDLNAKSITRISRTGEFDYNNIYNLVDTHIIINTTPVGMYPNNGECIVDLKRFPKLFGVLDVVYNPLKTELIIRAQEQNLLCNSGLTMLVAQAKYAAEYFSNKTIADSQIDKIEADIRKNISNLVLVGMPGCGKSTIGKIFADKIGMKFVDIDYEIAKKAKKSIAEIFETDGEQVFRDLETKIIAEYSLEKNFVISAGGGAVIREENRHNLKQNSIVVCVERDINLLATENRPLSKNNLELEKLARDRKEFYNLACDVKLQNNGSLEETVKSLEEVYYEALGY